MFGPIFKRRTPISLATSKGRPPKPGSSIQTSHALPRLVQKLKAGDRPALLDLGNVVGGNLQFFIDLGCRVTADDFLKPVETVLPEKAGRGQGWTPSGRRLDYGDASFDAALAWDLLDFLTPAHARDLTADLRRILKPGGIVLAYFTSRQSERRDPMRHFRILDPTRVEWATVGSAPSMRHLYQNRDIEKMFEGFRIHTAFFLKNGIRELLIEKRGATTKGPRPRAATIKSRSLYSKS